MSITYKVNERVTLDTSQKKKKRFKKRVGFKRNIIVVFKSHAAFLKINKFKKKKEKETHALFFFW